MLVRSLVALLLLITAACGAEEQPPLPAGEVALPLQRFELTPAEYAQIQRARMWALDECMTRFGIDLPLPEVHPARPVRAAALIGRLRDRDPERNGYRGPVGYQDDLFTAAARGATKAVEVPAAYVPVFDGTVGHYRGRPVPPGGCDGEVKRRLDAGADDLRHALRDDRVVPSTTFTVIEQEAQARAERDDSYRNAQTRWSRCMDRAGYHYATTADAEGDPRWATSVSITTVEPERDVTPEEITTATADARCRDEVRLPGTALRLHAEFQEELIADRLTALVQAKQLLDAQLRNSALIRNG
ncbi:hypothetical protein FHX81_2957 [Saccharothrix saharensis]|uniref:Lipoprotein n=1 Tax=Saccharothrix saharensis TaxID=571190 RepID=A0A543JCW4_9PSEU|nr:hypothetical protein [Saccharothrix saharensis]TQM80616.1 hypothetical protein FHX81_2957 [Saccharothrix saharensis]